MAPIIEKSFSNPTAPPLMTKRRAKHQAQDRHLNLMPNKLETEQLFRVLSNTPLQIET